MILLRLQTITFCKTIPSITDICLLFSLQVKPSIAVRGVYEILKIMGRNRGSSNIRVPIQKKDMIPEYTLALNCYRTLLIHHIQPRLTFICSLNSITRNTILVASLETLCVVEECLGSQCATVFLEGIAMHEHRLTRCIAVNGNYIKK